MKPTDSIDLGVTREVQSGVVGAMAANVVNKDADVFIAEQAVQRSISRFENAMEHLAQKAEVTHDKVQAQVQHTQHLINLPKQKLHEFDARFSHWARLKSYQIEDAARDLTEKIRFGARETIYEVRTNPVPYAWAAGIAGLFAGLLIFTGFAATESVDDEEEELEARRTRRVSNQMGQVPVQNPVASAEAFPDQYNY